ncbi:hypothetical protein ACTQ4P_18490 [Clostridium sporogenes]|uniref:hypothetical protein n=1 Tax=Clostridium sporogenes TaxID=1509 RepID=UPI0028FFBCC2|nr:hypothetical protein [Clostridium botulinum]
MEDVKKNKKPIYKKWWFWILAIIILGSLSKGIEGNNKSQNTATQQEQKKEDAKQVAEKKAKEEKEKKAKAEAEKKAKERAKKEDDKATLITTAQEVVKKSLKAPSTAKFPWNFGEYKIQEAKSENKDMVIYNVTGYVDAENSFGAKIRNNFTVKMECTKDLSKYKVLDINITE